VQWQILVNSGWVNVTDGTQSDGSVISGSKTDTLTVTNAQTDESGNDYWAVFSNSQGTIDTHGAFLTVTAAAPMSITRVTTAAGTRRVWTVSPGFEMRSA